VRRGEHKRNERVPDEDFAALVVRRTNDVRLL
jgi:hypothetical protein